MLNLPLNTAENTTNSKVSVILTIQAQIFVENTASYIKNKIQSYGNNTCNVICNIFGENVN